MTLKQFLTAILTKNYPDGFNFNKGICQNAFIFLCNDDYYKFHRQIRFLTMYWVAGPYEFVIRGNKYWGIRGWLRRRAIRKYFKDYL